MAGEEAVTLIERLIIERLRSSDAAYFGNTERTMLARRLTEAANRIEDLERELAGLQHTLDGLLERKP